MNFCNIWQMTMNGSQVITKRTRPKRIFSQPSRLKSMLGQRVAGKKLHKNFPNIRSSRAKKISQAVYQAHHSGRTKIGKMVKWNYHYRNPWSVRIKQLKKWIAKIL